MKLGPHELNITAQLILSGRELQLLNHLCSFNSRDEMGRFLAGMAGSHYAGGVTVAEMQEFLKRTQSDTEALLRHIQEHTKHVVDTWTATKLQ